MNLIRTPRHWLPQLVDVILTVIAWLVFIWLLFGSVAEIMVDKTRGPRMELGADVLSGLDSLVLYIILSLLMAATIVIWAAWKRRQAKKFQRRARVPDVLPEVLSKNFGIEASLMKELQSHRLMVLHNDRQGNLDSVEFLDKIDRPV